MSTETETKTLAQITGLDINLSFEDAKNIILDGLRMEAALQESADYGKGALSAESLEVVAENLIELLCDGDDVINNGISD